MKTFPLFHRLQGENCLVVGAGDIALHKAQLLLRAGATIRLVAPKINPAMREFVEKNSLEWAERN